MRVAVDVMGGDYAPKVILQGCWDAAPLLEPGDVVHLLGDEQVCREGLAASGLTDQQKQHYNVVPTTQVIAMDEPPVEAVRGKPDSSICVMCKMASKGEADVVISAGNTGACVAAAQLRMRLLPGVARPGIAVLMPTLFGPVVICDVGANVAPKPKHYQQYALMSIAYARAVLGIANPRVGLLSIGEEESKGSTSVKTSRSLLRDEPSINFIGNVEGKDLFRGVVDVVVTDGFTGNVVLKAAEGMAEGLFKAIAKGAAERDPALLAQIKPVLGEIYAKHDWQEHGGAPLLGVDGYCLIAHGRSEARAIMNAIRIGKQLVRLNVNASITQAISQAIPTED